MGKPALRIGDLTAHGGTVTVGKPTILIGKMPASTLGDMHVCPMTTGPVPHVGGPATMGSTGVMLGKMPGARVSDMHVCVGPPSMGAMGCMTVLLGEAGSGGDAGNAATAAAAKSASKNGPKAIKPFDPIEPPSPATENHWVEVQVVDSAGLPLGNIRYKLKDPNGADIVGSASPEGRIRHDGYAVAGSFKIEFPGIENAKWPSTKCKPNEALKLKAETIGITDGTPAMVVVFEERDNGRFQRQLARIPSQVSGGKVEASFTLLKEHYPLPFDPKKAAAFEESPEGKVEYFFFVEVEGLIGLSDRAQFREDARIEVLGADGKPVGGKDYQIQLIDGTVRKGKLDKDGKATEKDIPVGPYSLKLLGVEAGPVDKKPDPGPGPDPVEGLVFPLPRRPEPSYHKEELRFGAAREDKGAAKRRKSGARVPEWEMSRANAGCDLVAPADTPIFALKDGKVVRGPTGFSSTGQAIEVDHGEFLARYCELKPMTKPMVKAGDAVKQGDVVGYVARSAGVTMLHLEMYSGKAEGPLTVRPERISERDPESVKRFRRRADLMDPTAWLDRAMVKREKPAGAGEDEEDPVVVDDDADEVSDSSIVVLKSGDKGPAVEELNIRLSGFGGGLPRDRFDQGTVNNVKQFQKAYMGSRNPSGKVDYETARKIDDFARKFPIDVKALACSCGKCDGFGKNDAAKKGTYSSASSKDEKHHLYEYPGVHRSLLWAIKGLQFHASKLSPTRQLKCHSTYRCGRHPQYLQTKTENHKGKASDLHVYKVISSGKAERSTDTEIRKQESNTIRELAKDKISAQIGWNATNRFSLEPSNIAPTWVHLDVRTFESKYLEDRFFAKTTEMLEGKSMESFLEGPN